MPSSIPYNPALTLGSIVDPQALSTLLNISACQSVIETAHEKLKSFISLKRSIDMTIEELLGMDVEVDALLDNSKTIGESIVAAAVEYSNVRIEQEKKVQELRAGMQSVNAGIESPVDFDKTKLREMALSADSLNMDVQYFSNSANDDNAESHISRIKDFIAGSTENLGNAISDKISNAASVQINKQNKNHKVEGTLIIAASCTHRNAILLDPLLINIDKAISIWNDLYPEEADRINDKDPVAIQKILQITTKEKTMSLLSGASFGSSFIGMVHLLKNDTVKALSPEQTNSIQEQFTLSKWITKETGGFGIDPSLSARIKNQLTSNNISSHISILTMGIAPSLKSNEVRVGVKTFAEIESQKTADQYSFISNPADRTKTVSSSASQAQRGAEFLAIRGSSVQNVMSGLSRIDESSNKVLDINSMMTAFEDYINKVNQGKAGVPVNYFLKKYTRRQLAELWIAKYYPANK